MESNLFLHFLRTLNMQVFNCCRLIEAMFRMTIGKHFVTEHGLDKSTPIEHLFKVLKKCKNKFDCLIYEMLFVRDIN